MYAKLFWGSGLGVFIVVIAASATSAQNPEMSGAECIEETNCANCIAGSSTVQNQCPQPPHLLCGVSQSSAAGPTFAACQDTSSSENTCNPGGGTFDCGESSAWYCGCANGDGVCGVVNCDCDEEDTPDWTGNPPPGDTCTS